MVTSSSLSVRSQGFSSRACCRGCGAACKGRFPGVASAAPEPPLGSAPLLGETLVSTPCPKQHGNRESEPMETCTFFLSRVQNARMTDGNVISGENVEAGGR